MLDNNKVETSEINTSRPESSESSESSKDSKSSKLISDVIDNFLHRVLDIEDCANDFLPVAINKYNENAKRLDAEVLMHKGLLNAEVDTDKKPHNLKNLRKSLKEIDRHNSSLPVDTLEKSLFIYLFAAFDKYIGDLISVIYQLKPDLYKNIHKEILLSEVLQYESMDELRKETLNKEIETIKRKGYVEQFKDLEDKFSIKLSKFDLWPHFIESAQRRNLFTHCDGIVSKQYLDICKNVGVKFKKEPLIDDQLKIGKVYLFRTCFIISKVAVMLGHTLWRKTQPTDLDNADTHLTNVIFDFLDMENWGKAISLSEFALELPKISTEQTHCIFIINYAIALKSIENNKKAQKELGKKDWSATTYDFKLAHAVLTDDFSRAKDLMIRIGTDGELISELAYHDWPLFKDFRNSKEFLDAYEKVYGYKYSSKLTSLAVEKKSNIDENSSTE